MRTFRRLDQISERRVWMTSVSNRVDTPQRLIQHLSGRDRRLTSQGLPQPGLLRGKGTSVSVTLIVRSFRALLLRNFVRNVKGNFP